ncbi:hypothetical protein EUX98_g8970 [Antrodiella citrinella]|uniref:Zn(2)-C6 fungal-type domain-containing protein n=1 Tax=Antrodiella citrinella TaxID=2447956 RepID=A0A4S4M082_9APHY|nr:hypothetical protein EUX98_g8970 [Antrodiella citrinella]
MPATILTVEQLNKAERDLLSKAYEEWMRYVVRDMTVASSIQRTFTMSLVPRFLVAVMCSFVHRELNILPEHFVEDDALVPLSDQWRVGIVYEDTLEPIDLGDMWWTRPLLGTPTESGAADQDVAANTVPNRARAEPSGVQIAITDQDGRHDEPMESVPAHRGVTANTVPNAVCAEPIGRQAVVTDQVDDPMQGIETTSTPTLIAPAVTITAEPSKDRTTPNGERKRERTSSPPRERKKTRKTPSSTDGPPYNLYPNSPVDLRSTSPVTREEYDCIGGSEFTSPVPCVGCTKFQSECVWDLKLAGTCLGCQKRKVACSMAARTYDRETKVGRPAQVVRFFIAYHDDLRTRHARGDMVDNTRGPRVPATVADTMENEPGAPPVPKTKGKRKAPGAARKKKAPKTPSVVADSEPEAAVESLTHDDVAKTSTSRAPMLPGGSGAVHVQTSRSGTPPPHDPVPPPPDTIDEHIRSGHEVSGDLGPHEDTVVPAGHVAERGIARNGAMPISDGSSMFGPKSSPMHPRKGAQESLGGAMENTTTMRARSASLPPAITDPGEFGVAYTAMGIPHSFMVEGFYSVLPSVSAYLHRVGGPSSSGEGAPKVPLTDVEGPPTAPPAVNAPVASVVMRSDGAPRVSLTDAEGPPSAPPAVNAPVASVVMRSEVDPLDGNDHTPNATGVLSEPQDGLGVRRPSLRPPSPERSSGAQETTGIATTSSAEAGDMSVRSSVATVSQEKAVAPVPVSTENGTIVNGGGVREGLLEQIRRFAQSNGRLEVAVKAQNAMLMGIVQAIQQPCSSTDVDARLVNLQEAVIALEASTQALTLSSDIDSG